jgi:deoxyribodipyrimidine photo-lyase
MKALYWIRNDLRLQDNLAFNWMAQNGSEVLLIYFLPENFKNWGEERRNFHKETLDNFRDNLTRIGLSINISLKKPSEEIPKIIFQHQIEAMLFTKDFAFNETLEEELVLKNLNGIEIVAFDQMTMLHQEDLPFSLEELPNLFTDFKNKVENKIQIRPSLITPELKLKSLTLPQEKIDWGSLKANKNFQGGETFGLIRVQDYLWNTDSIKTYFESRNGMISFNDSSKFSPWLANGSLSARFIFNEILRYEEVREKSKSTYWIFYELLWRDYFKFYAKKFGRKIFMPNGISKKAHSFESNFERFLSWKEGRTDEPFINANMNELAQTGWMSNRGRQNVANYLAKTMKVNWIWGAEWFEIKLIDYDPCNNWGNWNYNAGVGTDQRDRIFHPPNQAMRYDPENRYQDKWLIK